MAQLESERQLKDEQFDYIQQVLRVICLKCEFLPFLSQKNCTRLTSSLSADGAALIYTSSLRPASIDSLRKYVQHRLFGTASSNAARGQFALDQKPSTVERETVFVPTGWDTYGKIKALRGNEDGFDPASVRRNWESDMLVELERRRRLQQGDTPPDDPSLKEAALRKTVIGADDSSNVRSAVELFDDIIGDFRPRDPPRSTASKAVQPDMQAFLAQHYAILQKDGDSKFSGSLGGTGTGAGAAEASSRSAIAREQSVRWQPAASRCLPVLKHHLLRNQSPHGRANRASSDESANENDLLSARHWPRPQVHEQARGLPVPAALPRLARPSRARCCRASSRACSKTRPVHLARRGSRAARAAVWGRRERGSLHVAYHLYPLPFPCIGDGASLLTRGPGSTAC